MAMAAMEAKKTTKWPSARALLNVDALDAVLGELEAQRENQESALGKLVRGVDAKADAAEVQQVEARLAAWTAKIGDEIKSVRDRIALGDRRNVQDADARSQHLGRVVAWQLRRIEQIDAVLARKATQERCDAVYDRLHALYTQMHREMRTGHAKIHDVDALRDAHAELARQVALVQQLLAGKLDRSAHAHLDGLAQRVRAFADSHDALLQRARTAEERLDAAESALGQQARQIQALQTAVKSLQAQADGAARVQDQELLAARLVQLQERAEASASAEDLSCTAIVLERTRDRVDQLAASVDTAIRPLQTKLASEQRSLAQRAESAAAQDRQSLETLRKDLALVKERLQQKASQTEFAALLKWSQAAKAQNGDLEKRMDFALRFIDWYSKSSASASSSASQKFRPASTFAAAPPAHPAHARSMS